MVFYGISQHVPSRIGVEELLGSSLRSEGELKIDEIPMASLGKSCEHPMNFL